MPVKARQLDHALMLRPKPAQGGHRQDDRREATSAAECASEAYVHGLEQKGQEHCPHDGLDEGPVVLQKETPISADDTLGTVYFDRLFPMGVKAMLEAADLVIANKHREVVQDESRATYEGWCRKAEAKLNWANHVDFVYNTIRGCNPAPGAWTTLEGKELQIFDARKHPVRTFSAVKGKIGEVVEVTDKSFQVTAQGGRIEVLRAKLADGKKVAAAELLGAGQIKAGSLLGA